MMCGHPTDATVNDSDTCKFTMFRNKIRCCSHYLHCI